MPLAAQLHAFTLENGLRVLLSEDHRLPLVAVHVAYRVGAADELPGQHGLAHLFEHLMYGGSANLPGTYLSHLFAAGAHDLNGRTTLDSTHYFETVHRDALDFALFAEADRMGQLVLGEETFERQRHVVLNELRQYRERSRGRFVERIDAGCYASGHPYRHGVIGTEADLQALSLEQARAFRQRHYHTGNAVLALAGDLTLDEAQQRCEHTFGGLRAAESIEKHEVAPMAARSQCFDDPTPRPQRRLVWQLHAMPSMLDREDLRLFQLALESRLRDELTADAIQPRIGLEFHRLATRFELEWNSPDQAGLERAFDAFEVAWSHLIVSGFSASQIEQARRLRWRRHLLSLDARSGVAARMIEGELAQRNSAAGFISLQQLETLDPTSVMRHWFAADDVSHRRLTPATKPPDEKPAQPAGWLGRRRKPPSSGTTTHTLESGLRFTLQARSGADLVSGRLLLRAGSSAEPAGQTGLAQLCADASLQARIGDASLRQQAEAIGCEISAEVQSDYLRLSWSVPLARWRETIALVAKFLSARIDADAFAAAQSRQRSAIALASMSAEAATQRVLPALLFGASQAKSRVGARIAGGLRSTATALSLERASAFKQGTWALRGAECVLVGDLEPEDVIESLKSWKVNAEAPASAIEALTPKAPSAVVHLLDIPGAQQTLLTVAWTLPVPSPQTEAPLRAFDLLLAGSFSSRLNLRLREELGWTYGVRSRLGEIAGARRYEIQVWIPVDRSLDARDEILRAVETFHRKGVDAGTLASLQRGEALRTVGHSERIEDAAREIESRLRLGLDPQQPTDWSTVTLKSVHDIAQRLDPDKAVSLLAGDAAQLRELPAKAGLAAAMMVDGDAEAL